MRESRAPRVARGAAAASVATFIALLSHVAAGGGMPGWLGVAVPWVLSLMVCTMLAGRRLSLVRLSIGVTLSQALFHTLFVLGFVSGSGAASVAHHHHHGPLVLPPLVAGETVAMIQADAVMWVAHAVAAVVTIAALYRGERAVARLRTLADEARGWARRTIARTLTPAPAPVPVRLRVAHTVVRSIRSAPELSPLIRRGPPVSAAF